MSVSEVNHGVSKGNASLNVKYTFPVQDQSCSILLLMTSNWNLATVSGVSKKQHAFLSQYNYRE